MMILGDECQGICINWIEFTSSGQKQADSIIKSQGSTRYHPGAPSNITRDVTGTLPPALADAANLQTFGAGANFLSGTLPAAYGNLSRLISLRLGPNNLTGSIADEFARSTSLQARLFYRSPFYFRALHFRLPCRC